MSDTAKGQITSSAAEIYEQFFIPALFHEWPPRLYSAAHIQPTDHVLDVACGTGVLTRYIADYLSPSGSIIGLDINEGMLAVAKQESPQIQWQQGAAESLPFPNNTFEAVVSQFALMFFQDRQTALKEMLRVLRPNGHLAIAVWDSIEASPGYYAMANLLQRLFSDQAANALRYPFNLGDTDLLRSIFADAGIPNLQITTHQGTAHFPSIESWVYTDIKGWTLADTITDDQYALLLAEATNTLQPFATPDGKVSFPSPAHIITYTKPQQ